jgi:gliding motility-associated-like protein
VVSRFNDQSGFYDILDTLTNLGQTILYTDLASNGNQRSEIYRFTALDQCSDESLYTEPIGTIYLESIENSTLRNELSWNEYVGWETGVSEYHILRDLQNNGFGLLAILPGNVVNYTDDLSDQEENFLSHDIKYRIMAIESAGNPFGFRDTVYSNIKLIAQDDGIFIPNAINILSSVQENRIFKPVFSRGAPENYTLSVFNRWGQSVFQSNDPGQGWDGRITGSDAPAGVYSYILEYGMSDGIMQKKAGVFILMK